MKTILLSVLLLTSALSLPAQFSVNWATISGGGGRSSGGVHSIQASIGQPAPGASGAGGYSLQAGFWATPVVMQTPGAPPLRIARIDTNTVLLAWPVTSTTFTLQVNNDLATTNWSTVANPANLVGSENQVAIPFSAAPRFYRLQAP